MTRLLRFIQEHAQEAAEHGADAAEHGSGEFDLGEGRAFGLEAGN